MKTVKFQRGLSPVSLTLFKKCLQKISLVEHSPFKAEHGTMVIILFQPTHNNMSNNLTQSSSSILSMVMTCHNTAELAKWMVKQPEWKKWKESNLKKKSLGKLQNMCTVHQ
jgi:hypothetical protein